MVPCGGSIPSFRSGGRISGGRSLPAEWITVAADGAGDGCGVCCGTGRDCSGGRQSPNDAPIIFARRCVSGRNERGTAYIPTATIRAIPGGISESECASAYRTSWVSIFARSSLLGSHSGPNSVEQPANMVDETNSARLR